MKSIEIKCESGARPGSCSSSGQRVQQSIFSSANKNDKKIILSKSQIQIQTTNYKVQSTNTTRQKPDWTDLKKGTRSNHTRNVIRTDDNK